MQAGSIDPAAFSTGPIFLQIAVGTAANVLLPRTIFTSQGYAFVTENAVGNITPKSVAIPGIGVVIDATGRWVGPAVGGGPNVTRVTDFTGGRTVSGDLLRIQGSGLAQARVLVGGKESRLKSRTASEIIAQVPPGLPLGINTVTVTEDGGTSGARLVSTIELSRYLLTYSGDDSQLLVLDPQEVLAGRTPLVATIGINILTGGSPRVSNPTPTFANQGSLMMIPNNSGDLILVDMTTNPPSIFNTQDAGRVGTAVAVAVNPSDEIAVVSDHANNQFETLNMLMTARFPPYSGSVFTIESDSELRPPNPPSGFGPRGLTFVDDFTLLVVGDGSGQIISYQRGIEHNETKLRFLPQPAVSPSGTSFLRPVMSGAFNIKLLPDRVRALVHSTQSAAIINATRYFAGEAININNEALMTGALQVDFAGTDPKVLVNANFNNAQSGDVIQLNYIDGKFLDFFGLYPGPEGTDSRFSNTHFRIAAVEPSLGEWVVAVTNMSTFYFFRMNGGVLKRLDNVGTILDEGEFIPGSSGVFENPMWMGFQP